MHTEGVYNCNETMSERVGQILSKQSSIKGRDVDKIDLNMHTKAATFFKVKLSRVLYKITSKYLSSYFIFNYFNEIVLD